MAIRRRAILVVAGLGVVVTLLCLPWGSRAKPNVTLQPLGRSTSSLGAVWFVLAVTNNTHRRTDVRVDWKQVVASPAGEMRTNSRWADMFTLAPKTGSRVNFSPPQTQDPWTVRVRSQPFPGKLETWARALGSWLRVCGTDLPPSETQSLRIEE